MEAPERRERKPEETTRRRVNRVLAPTWYLAVGGTVVFVGVIAAVVEFVVHHRNFWEFGWVTIRPEHAAGVMLAGILSIGAAVIGRSVSGRCTGCNKRVTRALSCCGGGKVLSEKAKFCPYCG